MASSDLMLWRRNAVFLYLSLLVSGTTTVLAQHFFMTAAPDAKYSWLVAALLLGTFGSSAGIAAARRIGFPGPPLLFGSALVWAVTGLLLLSFFISHPALYVMVHVATRGVANFLTQELDRRSVMLAPEPLRQANDRIATGLRFLGMLLGPLWFGIFPGPSPATVVLCALLLSISLGSVFCLRNAPPGPARGVARSPLLLQERMLLWSATAIYGGYYLLASNTVYVLSDAGVGGDVTRFGGLLIATVFGAAFLTTFLLSTPQARQTLHAALAAPVMLIAAGLLLRPALTASAGVALFSASVLGVGFALFLLSFRGYVSLRARRGADIWISAFNNLGNTSSLVGFGAMGALVFLSRLTGVGFGTLLSAGLVALGAAGFAAMLPSAREGARQESVPVQ